MQTDLTPQQERTEARTQTAHKKRPLPLAQTAMVLILCAGVIAGLVLALGSNTPAVAMATTPPPVATPVLDEREHPVATAAPVLTASPAPTPTPVPTPEPYDFSRPAPETEAVDDTWFDDAVFVGDSRTDGLRLFGGIPGAEFIEQTGITVFEVSTRKAVKVAGEKYTVLEALGLKEYGKVFLMLGVNELGYGDDEAFRTAYAGLVDSIRAKQPGAVVYLQNLPPINPEKAKANNTPYYVTNEKIADYNAIIAQVAEEKQAVLVDVAAALADENGILPRDGTSDGVHFSKDYYTKWHAYLNQHTVDPDLYWAGQTENE